MAEIENSLSRLRTAVEALLCSESLKQSAPKRLVTGLSGLLKRSPENEEMFVLNEAAFWLANPACEDAVWNWLLRVARTASDPRKTRLTIAVFENLVERPKINKWIVKLFQSVLLWDLAWILTMAYETREAELFSDLERSLATFSKRLPGVKGRKGGNEESEGERGRC